MTNNDHKITNNGHQPTEVIQWALREFEGRVRLASSFGAEDMVLIDMLSRVSDRPPVFTLDTGRLPHETYDLIDQVQRRYRLDLKVYFPKADQVEAMVSEHGANLFYRSLENRKLCCAIRKVEPLERALKGLDAWFTGLRQDQTPDRATLQPVETDERGLVKISPLLSWTEDEVWAYIRKHDVPFNRLHEQGYRTIGCAPCTRAVSANENPRNGRWWWESDLQKECGLHVA